MPHPAVPGARASTIMVLATGLAACAESGTRTPSASVEYPWQDIRPAQSAMVISGPEDHRHRAHRIGSRYQEQVRFTNGAYVFYEQLEGTHVVFGVSASDVLASWYKSDSVKEAGFAYKGNAVRRNGESYFVTDFGTNRTCSLYARVFGSTAAVGNGDQLYRIEYCLPSGPDAAARTERLVNELADRLQDTPEIAKAGASLSLDAASQAPVAVAAPASSAAAGAVATPAAAASPTARPSPPPQAGTNQPAEVDTICYSSRLQSVYHAGTCWAGDRSPTPDEAISYRARNQFVSKAANDEALLTIPPAGTRIYNSIGGYREYVALEGPVVVYKAANRRVFSTIGGIKALSENETLPVDVVASLWPLRVGKSVTYVNQGKTASWDEELQVLRRERITVPAGSFETFVVQEHQKGRGSNYHDSYRTYWYAPSVGGLVKFDIRLLAGTTDLKPWEALSIAAPAAKPAPAPPA